LFRQGTTLMLYDVASKRSRQVATLNALDADAIEPSSPARFDWENRRVEEQTLQWDPSGKQILYLARGDLFLIQVNDGQFRQLTKTSAAERDPKLSPDGKRVAFLRDADLYTMDVATGKESRLTSNGSDTLRNGAPDWVYPEELDLGSAYWWSPDSRAIAYL